MAICYFCGLEHSISGAKTGARPGIISKDGREPFSKAVRTPFGSSASTDSWVRSLCWQIVGSVLCVPGDMGDQETMFANADWSEDSHGGVCSSVSGFCARWGHRLRRVAERFVSH